MKREFLTATDVATLLKPGERTIYQRAREGRIGGGAEIRGQWRREKAALLKCLEAGGEAPRRSA